MHLTRAATLSTILGLTAMASTCAATNAVVRTATPSVGWFGRTFGSLSWESAVAATTSPSSISWQVRRHLTYSLTPSEHWDDGRLTWQRGYGDCKAFAYCVADLCESKGIPCWVAVVRPKGERIGHAVTMGVWHGKLWMSSNGRYSEHDSLEQALGALVNIAGFRGKSLEFVPFSLM